MNKKAQGLSLNTIIIAIIVLIVLVVIIMVFTGYFGNKFTPGITACENSGGSCKFGGADGCGFDSFGSKVSSLDAKCSSTSQTCCPKDSGKKGPADASVCGQENSPCCQTGEQCDSSKGLVCTNGACKKPSTTATTGGTTAGTGSTGTTSGTGSSTGTGSTSSSTTGGGGPGSNPLGGLGGTKPDNAPITPVRP